MKKLWLIFLLSLVVSPLLAEDSIDTLIDTEKSNQAQWTDEDDTLPAVELWGDSNAVEIYAPAASEGEKSVMCESLPLDELIELSRESNNDDEIVINTALPRIKEVLEKSCLVRPNDVAMAVGPGWQTKVVLENFVVRKNSVLCPNRSPYSLWMTYETPLQEKPIFLSTSDQLKEGFNKFNSSGPISSKDLEAATRRELSSAFPNIDEFDAFVYSPDAKNCHSLVLLRKRVVSPEDDGLVNEVLLSKKDSGYEKLWIERIDSKKESGHIKLEGIFDYNADGFVDLYITGDHAGCPYGVIFEGDSEGFHLLNLPIKPCHC